MADVLNTRTDRSTAPQQSTAELVQHAADQISRLVRNELALARSELTEKGKHAGIGVGLFGGGGVLALFGVGTLVASAVLLLALAMPNWVAALIVAIVLFGIAGIFALIGKNQVKRAAPPVPGATADSVRADLGTVSAAVKNRGRHDGR